ncbi:LamG-like jellyroll fold domain-containing protein [Streptomyces sp. NPDC087420]|uniref:LamG-like jellyroll fold domain-containing protein n=1 Tax=Streptomyces sp. NPDC087420 TaxID=3365785 RepID=UPI003833E585
MAQALGGFAAQQAAAATPTATGQASSASDNLSPEAAASQKAVSSDAPVVVADETTPTQLVTAHPDGTFTVDVSPGPVRVQQGGAWVPVDTDLRLDAAGAVVPKAAAVPMEFSGGGSTAPLARMGDAGKTYTVGSPWTLPAPVLAGATATYQNVMPGIDLVVEATPDGFSENLVVKTRGAATGADLARIAFPVSLDGVAVRDSGAGGAALVSGDGRPVFTTGTGLMYDSTATVAGSATVRRTATPASTPAQDTGSVLDGPDPGAKTSVMDVALTSAELTITPDQDFLTDPDTTFPVVLDPQTTSASLSGWTTVWSNSTSTSFWKTSHALGVGYDAFLDDKFARSLYQFDTHTLGGKKVLSATFTALEVWSANCSAKSVQLWRTGAISSSTTWAHQPSWSAQVDSVSTAKGYSSSCPGGNVSFDATSAVSYTAGQSSATTTLGLRASETDSIAWKQFASPSDTKPTLSVTFVSAPSTPTGLKLSSPLLACGASSSVAVNIRTLTPTLSAVVQSADGSQATLRPNFALYQYDPDIADPQVASGSPSAYVTDGKTGTWTTPKLKDGQTYWFKARTEYHYSFNGTAASMYSGWTTTGACAFHIDTKKPAPPVISSTTYPACATAEDPGTCTAFGGVGASGAFTVKTANDVVKYTYTLNDNKAVTRTIPAGTTSSALTLAPDRRDLNQLTVTTWDAAGNSSESASYFFKVAPGTPPSAAWSFDENTGSLAADSASSNTMTLHGAQWTPLARQGASALSTDGTSSYAATAAPGVDTSGSFTLSAWVRVTDLSRTQVAVSQEGTTNASSALYYSQGANAWIFAGYTANATGTTIIQSKSEVPPVPGVWTHLAGTYDKQDQTIQLYVNGEPQGSPVPFTTAWKATGALDVGRGLYNSVPNNYFGGRIDDVRVWNRVVAPQETADLQAEENPETGHAQPALVSEWTMEDGPGGTLADTSGYGHTMSLGSGASLVSDAGGKGDVLSLDGTATGYASAPGPLVDSRGDFTVSAWTQLDAASLSDTTVAHTVAVAGQSGTTRDSWALWYSQPAGSDQGMWVFGRTASDSTGAAVVSVPADIASAQKVDPGSWTMLTGVYDGARHQLLLYVNGVRQGALGDADTDDNTGDGTVFDTPWQATGAFSAGRGRTAGGTYGNPATALLDDVRVWTGVTSASDINQRYLDELPIPL